VKIIAGVVLMLLSLAAAIGFYWGQPIYLVVFALAGLILAAYVGLMARLIGKRLPFTIFISVWALALIVMSSAEGWLRSQSHNQPTGLLPGVISAFHRWNNPYSLSSPPATKEVTASPPTPSIIDNEATRLDLKALIAAELCNDNNLERLRQVADMQVSDEMPPLPAHLGNGQGFAASAGLLYLAETDQALFQKIYHDKAQNFQIAMDKGQGILSNYKGPNASQVMQEFRDGQGQLVSSSRNVDQQLAPIFQLFAHVMELAVYVKQTGHASPDEEQAWTQYLHLWNSETQGQALIKFMTSMRDQRDEGFNKLHRLVGDYTTDSLDLSPDCTSDIPYNMLPNQADHYTDQIMARWNSSDWLIKGRKEAGTVP
jgi:hypothetical protein